MCRFGDSSEAGMASEDLVLNWNTERVYNWLVEKGHGEYATLISRNHQVDGKALLLMNETDLRNPPMNIKVLGAVKRIALDIRQLKSESRQVLMDLGYDPQTLMMFSKNCCNYVSEACHMSHRLDQEFPLNLRLHNLDGSETECVHPHSSRSSEDGHATTLQPEMWKAFIALAYCFVVTWITAFVMVIVHDRVPDMKKYPPLPDIFLDNVPHIPWAFHMCEWTGTLLLLIWLAVLLVHKHRFILLRRFFALSGTVFLLRCITMLITSLSVPGTHLDCNPRSSTLYSEDAGFVDLLSKMKEAYVIWKGAGMSIQGVRTCGDYMFSGHTVALTMLNFFITEYSPRDIYLLHTFTWLLNMFGIFFILSGHEHYSIDVFIAFYITSRLFLYYHTLANNQSLMQRDTGRTRIWFPLFSFFESGVDGIVPNEYESPVVLIQKLMTLSKLAFRRTLFLFQANLTLKFSAQEPPSTSHPTSKRNQKKVK